MLKGKEERASNLQFYVGRQPLDHIPTHKSTWSKCYKTFIEETVEVDLELKPASLWWTITFASEEKDDMIPSTSKGCYKFSFEDEFRILGCVMNRQGKTCDAVEERMQSANKAFWEDIMIYKSEDVPWRVKCQRLVEPCVCRFSPLEVKPSHGRSRHWKI